MGPLTKASLDGSNVKWAGFTQNGAGTVEVVAAVAGKRLRILNFFAVATASTATLTLKSGTTVKGGVMTPAAGVPVAFMGAPFGYAAETAKGEAFNLTVGGAGVVSGFVNYVEL